MMVTRVSHLKCLAISSSSAHRRTARPFTCGVATGLALVLRGLHAWKL